MSNESHTVVLNMYVASGEKNHSKNVLSLTNMTQNLTPPLIDFDDAKLNQLWPKRLLCKTLPQ